MRRPKTLKRALELYDQQKRVTEEFREDYDEVRKLLNQALEQNKKLGESVEKNAKLWDKAQEEIAFLKSIVRHLVK